MSGGEDGVVVFESEPLGCVDEEEEEEEEEDDDASVETGSFV